MYKRLLAFLTLPILLISCSSSGADVSKTVDISADRLAEIRAKPYTAGNNPGGFAAAALSIPGNGSGGGGVRFTGFGPYLHDMGFTNNMVITAVDGVDVADIFFDRWQDLRLQDPSAFDAAHYKDLIEYLFAEERGSKVVLAIDVNVSATTMAAGELQPKKELWRVNLAN